MQYQKEYRKEAAGTKKQPSTQKTGMFKKLAIITMALSLALQVPVYAEADFGSVSFEENSGSKEPVYEEGEVYFEEEEEAFQGVQEIFQDVELKIASESYSSEAARIGDTSYDEELGMYVTTFESNEDAVEALSKASEELGEDEVILDIPMTIQANGWGTQAMNIDKKLASLSSDTKAKIAIADSGFYPDHEIFKNVTISTASKSFIDGEEYNTDSTSNSHGTNVSGIIAENIPAGSELLILKTVGTNNTGSVLNFLKAVEYAAEQGADVINISAGVDLADYETVFEEAGTSVAAQLAAYNRRLKAATEKGLMIVTASGNTSNDIAEKISFPAISEYTITVSGIMHNESLWTSGNYGDAVDFTAPAYGVACAIKDTTDGYALIGGTSIATAYISAQAGILKAEGLNSAEAFQELINISKDLGAEGKDKYFGYGFPVFKTESDPEPSSLEYHAKVEPTCTSDGTKEYYYDPATGKCYADSERQTEITDLVIPATGHEYHLSDSKAATCEEDGYQTFTCSHDASHTYTTKITKLGHDYQLSETKDATCTEAGYKKYVCTHDSSHYYQTDIPALNHSWGEWQVLTEATEDHAGEKIRYCKNDSAHFEKETIPQLEHTHQMTHHVKVEAKCEEDGNIEYWYCEKCKKYYADAEGSKELTLSETIIPEKGHEWDEGKITKAPTKSEHGILTYTCKHDASHTKQVEIAYSGFTSDKISYDLYTGKELEIPFAGSAPSKLIFDGKETKDFEVSDGKIIFSKNFMSSLNEKTIQISADFPYNTSSMSIEVTNTDPYKDIYRDVYMKTLDTQTGTAGTGSSAAAGAAGASTTGTAASSMSSQSTQTAQAQTPQQTYYLRDAAGNTYQVTTPVQSGQSYQIRTASGEVVTATADSTVESASGAQTLYTDDKGQLYLATANGQSVTYIPQDNGGKELSKPTGDDSMIPLYAATAVIAAALAVALYLRKKQRGK